jgi:hypothetical protein
MISSHPHRLPQEITLYPHQLFYNTTRGPEKREKIKRQAGQDRVDKSNMTPIRELAVVPRI